MSNPSAFISIAPGIDLCLKPDRPKDPLSNILYIRQQVAVYNGKPAYKVISLGETSTEQIALIRESLDRLETLI